MDREEGWLATNAVGGLRPSGVEADGCLGEETHQVAFMIWAQSSTSFCRLNATQQRLSAFSQRLWAEITIGLRVINTDEHAGYPPAIVRLKAEETLEKNCRHRPVQYLNNVLEQDHRAIKRRVRASQHFRSFWGAWRTISGYEVIDMIRKGQAYGSVPVARGGLLHCFILGLFSAVTGQVGRGNYDSNG